MAKTKDAERYGAEIGAGIKKSLQGLNTNCSPKKRKTCIFLILVPLVLSLIGLYARQNLNTTAEGSFVRVVYSLFIALGTVAPLGLGLYQFYVGRIGKGALYTVTLGGLLIGCLIDLFKLLVPKTFKDANGFPLIY